MSKNIKDILDSITWWTTKYDFANDIRIYDIIFNHDGNVVNFEMKTEGYHEYELSNLLIVKLSNDKKLNSKLYKKLFGGKHNV